MAAARQYAIHAGLFVATCVTTWLAGGVAFSATLMSILVCHEMGHYVAARRYGLDVSLPYFIPLPPFITLGTLGAVIRMRAPIRDRNQLLVVGAAGPLAGLVIAIPALVIGLELSTVGPIPPDSALEGNSILYGLTKYALFGRWLPANGMDVNLHPMAFAAWVGLLVTMINLIPIGQLDGGHVMRAWLDDKHERISAYLHRGLLAVALVGGVVLFLLAADAGLDTLESLGYAAVSVMPWLIWALALTGMRSLSGGEYHPPVVGPPLDRARRRLAIAMIIVFILLFVPVPMRASL
ncbi:MAG: site-2 protease family protein [Deltaproteobacteria bacterium]|nr:site-2 protease family protein [Kofleriaceae bacterium]